MRSKNVYLDIPMNSERALPMDLPKMKCENTSGRNTIRDVFKAYVVSLS